MLFVVNLDPSSDLGSDPVSGHSVQKCTVTFADFFLTWVQLSSSVPPNVSPVRQRYIGRAVYVKDFISLKTNMYHFQLKLCVNWFIKNNRAPSTTLL